MADVTVKTRLPARSEAGATSGPTAEAPKTPSGPGGFLDAQRAAGNQATHGTVLAQSPEPTGLEGQLASMAIELVTLQFPGSGVPLRIGSAAIRGFVSTLADEVSLTELTAGLKELMTPSNLLEFTLAYQAGSILGLVSPVTDLFGIVVLAEQLNKMAEDLGRAAWEHPEELIAKARALGDGFRTFLKDTGKNLSVLELLKHIGEVSDNLMTSLEAKAGEAGSSAAHSVVLHFSGKEEEQPAHPAEPPAGYAGRLEQWATETRKKLTNTQWSRLGYNIGYDVGAIVSNTLLFVFSFGAGEAVAAIGAELGKLGGLLARVGTIAEKMGAGIKVIEDLIAALMSKPMKWLEPVMKPFFELLERLKAFLRELLGFVDKNAAKTAVTALEKRAAEAAAPGPPHTPKPPAPEPHTTPKPTTPEPHPAPEPPAPHAIPPSKAGSRKKKATTSTKRKTAPPKETAPPKPPPSGPKAAPRKRGTPQPETHTEELLIDDAEVLAQQGMSTRKSLQELNQEAAEGRRFEKRLASPQRQGQVPIYDKKGRRNRLDYYDAAAGEIISVKSLASANGQIAFVDEFTMLKHFQEFPLKYPNGARVMKGKLAGTVVAGRYVLEVPPQLYPIPDRILQLARTSRVMIRDASGKIWQ